VNRLLLFLGLTFILCSSTCGFKEVEFNPCNVNYIKTNNSDITAWPKFGIMESQIKTVYQIDQYLNPRENQVFYAFYVSVLGNNPYVIVFDCLGNKIGSNDLDQLDILMSLIDEDLNKNKTVYEL